MIRIFIGLLCLLLTSCLSLPALPQRGQGSAPGSNSYPSEKSGIMRLYFPDVGQGDATLLISPEGRTLLIDAGPPSAGRDVLLPLFRTLSISRLDSLLITHYDLDHLGGVPSLLAGEDGQLGTEDDVLVGVAYDRGGKPWDNSPGLNGYLFALLSGDIPRQSLEAGQTLSLDNTLRLEILAANGTVRIGTEKPATIDLTPKTYSGKENAASIALLIEYGGFRYLTAGDLTGGGMTDGYITPDVESLLAETVGAVDVVHVNHHGSLSSSNESFVKTTKPQAVVIQAGKDNPYGHPNRDVVERWRQIGAEIHLTSEEGGIILESDGDGFGIDPIGNQQIQ